MFLHIYLVLIKKHDIYHQRRVNYNFFTLQLLFYRYLKEFTVLGEGAWPCWPPCSAGAYGQLWWQCPKLLLSSPLHFPLVFALLRPRSAPRSTEK